MRAESGVLIHQDDGKRAARSRRTGTNPCDYRIKDTDRIGVCCAIQRADSNTNPRGGAI